MIIFRQRNEVQDMKIGILGAGRIAVKMAETISELKNKENMVRAINQMYPEKKVSGQEDWLPKVECTAVAARELERAEEFAKIYNFKKAYGSYEMLLADPEIDIVYIALPHSHHCQWTKAALEAGKNVLCEKAFAMNLEETKEMIELARKKNLLLAEAIWTRYMPARKIIDGIVQRGELGIVHSLSANLGYPVTQKERIMRPELGGGALLDLTVYPLNFASMVLGDDIKEISASCIMDTSGVDGQDQVMICYKDGKMATLFSSIYTITDRSGWIFGEEGMLEIQNINNPEAIRLYTYKDGGAPCLIKEYEVPSQISGYEYELVSCALAIIENKIECQEMPHSQTLEIMRQMDLIRKTWKAV